MSHSTCRGIRAGIGELNKSIHGYLRNITGKVRYGFWGFNNNILGFDFPQVPIPLTGIAVKFTL